MTALDISQMADFPANELFLSYAIFQHCAGIEHRLFGEVVNTFIMCESNIYYKSHIYTLINSKH